MKTVNNLLLFILTISLSVLSFTEVKAQTSATNPPSGQAGYHIRIRGGTENTIPQHPCFGSGGCGPCAGICLVISRFTDANFSSVLPGEAVVDFTLIDSGHLKIDFNGVQSDNGGTVTIANALLAPPDVTQGLGQTILIILPGTYALDFSANPYGSIVANAIVF